MPYSEAGKLDYFVFIMFLVVFIWSFFFYPNMQIILAPLILIYEMFVIYVLPGKPRLREINKRFYIMLFILMVKKKFREGIQEYHDWKKK